MDRQAVITKIKQEKIIAIIRGVEKDKCFGVVEALHKAGINLFEVTFNTLGVLEIIAKLNQMYGDKLCLGAGTVLEKDQVDQAYQAGAKYILSPDTCEEVIKHTRKLGLVSIPGALSSTEVRFAQKCGADLIKIFPAATMGIAYLKDILGPLEQSQLIAVGGINLDNSKAFLDAGAVALGVGGTLIDKKLIANNQMNELTELGRKFIEQIKK